ncbi:MAG TPA: response regulator [Verrucomicrobiae bacterium]|nr:response regulator [Verrucomicrobiae bacterium]
MRILLADDSSVNQEVALGQLQKLGYAADVVNNGLEVLEAIQFLRYDVILMDCQMPELTGNEAARRIREQEQQSSDGVAPVYIIAMTASTVDGDREACKAAGMNGYLTKPVMVADLRAALEDAAASVSGVAVTDVSQTVRQPAEVHPEHAPVDLQRLTELTGGKPEKLRGLIDKYGREASEMMNSLGSAVEAGSAAEIRRWAHKLGGTSATCGMKALVPPLQELEKLSQAGDVSLSATLFGEVMVRLSQTQQFLKQHLETVAAG